MRQAALQPSAQAPLAYKPEGGGFAGSLVGALVITFVLLGLTYVFLRIAKQKGWLTFLGASTQGAGRPANTLEFIERLRLSPKTTLYKVRDGHKNYLVLESQGGIHLQEVDRQDGVDVG